MSFIIFEKNKHFSNIENIACLSVEEQKMHTLHSLIKYLER